MTELELHGFGVLVTRPEAQAAELLEAIQAKGGTAHHFPAIEILPRDATTVASEAANLDDPDIAIFASRNAVQFGASYTAHAKIAAIGSGTEAALRATGRSVDIQPGAGFDSENLLQHPALADVSGKVVRIIRGSSGREMLADGLRERGATVTYIAVYDRQRPVVHPDERQKLEKIWCEGGIQAITVMSVETLTNLLALLPKRCLQDLEQVPLVTPALRVIKEIQKRRPAARTILAASPQATDMLDAIISLQQTEPGQST